MSGREAVEVEVKFAVSRPRAMARWIRELDRGAPAGFEPAGPARTVTHTDRYVDTAAVGGRLGAVGMRARLRRDGRRVRLGVKRAGVEHDGVTTRTELEAPATASLDPRRWPPSEARAALLEVVGDEPLAEIGRLRQRRLVRAIRRGRTTVELSLDRVDASSGGVVAARRHELELELKAGNEADLADLARAMGRDDRGLGPAHGSKLSFALEVR